MIPPDDHPRPGDKYVKITAPADRLEELKDVLRETSFHIAQDRGDHLLHHPSFNAVDSVENAASEVASWLEAAYEVATGRPLGLSVDHQVQYDKDGRRTIIANFQETLTITTTATLSVTHADGTTTVVRPTDPIPDWLTKIEAHPHLARAMRLFATQGDSWVGLYKVYESLRQHVGDRAMLDVTSKKQLGRFTGTANNCDAVGDDARHAKKGLSIVKDPMSLGEARGLIQNLLGASCRQA